MGTAQIIILSGLSLLFLIVSFRTIHIHGEKLEFKDRVYFSFSMVVIIAIYFIILLVAITTTSGLNSANEKLKNKCPELVKVENVYKIK